MAENPDRFLRVERADLAVSAANDGPVEAEPPLSPVDPEPIEPAALEGIRPGKWDLLVMEEDDRFRREDSIRTTFRTTRGTSEAVRAVSTGLRKCHFEKNDKCCHVGRSRNGLIS